MKILKSRLLKGLVLMSSLSFLFSLKPFTTVKTMVLEGENIKIYKGEEMVMRRVNQKEVFQIEGVDDVKSEDRDLFIDFNSQIQHSENYRVIYSNFELNKYQKIGWGFSGKFYFSDNYISLLPLSTSLFAPGNITGSFSIDFWLYVYKNYDNQYIIKYIGNNLSDEKDKNVYGFSIFIRNNQLHYRFDNFFWNEKNESFSIEIKEDEGIALNNWEHHGLTFNIKNGRIATYKNGIEQEIKWATREGKPLSAILIPKINENLSSPVLIGKGGFFSIDNLNIEKIFKPKFNLRKYKREEYQLITDTYHFSDNFAFLKRISFDVDVPQFSFAKFAYRISDSYFLPDNSDIRWVYMQNNAENFPEDYNLGKYIQFKVTVYPYEEEKEDFNLRSIRLDYIVDNSPDVPAVTRVIPLDKKIEITWVPSPEDDISGYEIYYGNRMGDYVCSDAQEGKSPIFVPVQETGRLTPITFTVTGLVNEKPYFISLRTVDKRGHRSIFSKEFYARPSSIYSEKKYSVGR